jgi:hypothetical protein
MELITILLIIQLVIGISLIVSGANILHTLPGLGGFMLGGLVGMEIGAIVITSGPLVPYAPLIGFLAAGLVGVLIAIPLSIVLIVLSGSLLGAVVGAFVGNLILQQGSTIDVIQSILQPQTLAPVQILMILGFAAIFALLTIRFDEFMLILSTSFLGAYLTVIAATNLIGDQYELLRNSLILLFLWALLGMLGTVYQNDSFER